MLSLYQRGKIVLDATTCLNIIVLELAIIIGISIGKLL